MTRQTQERTRVLQTLALIAALWLSLAVAYVAWPILRSRITAPKRGVRVLKEAPVTLEATRLNDRVALATAALERPMPPRRVALPFPIAPGSDPATVAPPPFLAHAVASIAQQGPREILIRPTPVASAEV